MSNTENNLKERHQQNPGQARTNRASQPMTNSIKSAQDRIKKENPGEQQHAQSANEHSNDAVIENGIDNPCRHHHYDPLNPIATLGRWRTASFQACPAFTPRPHGLGHHIRFRTHDYDLPHCMTKLISAHPEAVATGIFDNRKALSVSMCQQVAGLEAIRAIDHLVDFEVLR